MISFLLAGCIPSAEAITASATMLVPTLTPASTSTPIFTPTPALTRTSVPARTLVPADNNGDPVLVGAGDIAHCNSEGDEATAKLLDNIPGTVFTTGDNVYPDGTTDQFANCY